MAEKIMVVDDEKDIFLLRDYFTFLLHFTF